MKKTISLLFFALLMWQGVSAHKAWTVELVPNTRLQSNYIHVSDPDGYISEDIEMSINTALCAIRQEADVFLVALSSIGDNDPQVFRNELFNSWHIGDKDKNNGLLLLFVEDQHAFEFETGYGIEPILTDAKCFEIFNHTMKPYFKKGDYGGGMFAGVQDIVKVFGGTMPSEMVTVLPDEQLYEQAKTERDKETTSNFFLWTLFFLCCCFPVVSGLRYLAVRKKEKAAQNTEIKDSYAITKKDGLNYIVEPSTSWSGSAWEGKGCSRACTFGLSGIVWFFVSAVVLSVAMEGEEQLYISNWVAAGSLFSYLTYICVMHNRRTLKMADKVAKTSLNPRSVYDKAENNSKTKLVNIIAPWIGLLYYKKKYETYKQKCPELLCPDCHQAMKFDETAAIIPEKEAAEMTNEARRYTSLRCPSGHVLVMKEKGKKYKSYIDCVHCGAHLAKQVRTKVVKSATYTHSGLKEVIYGCLFCHQETIRTETIPKLEHSSSSSSGGSYHSSSSSSGGSFGGGSSGGGGYSGRW